MRLYETCDYLMREDASCDNCYRLDICMNALKTSADDATSEVDEEW